MGRATPRRAGTDPASCRGRGSSSATWPRQRRSGLIVCRVGQTRRVSATGGSDRGSRRVPGLGGGWPAVPPPLGTPAHDMTRVRRMLDAYATGHAWTPPGPAKEPIWWCRFFVDGWWAALPPGAVLAHLLACRQDAPAPRRTGAVPRPQATSGSIASTLTARFGELSEAARGAVLLGPWTAERVADGLTRLAERADVTAASGTSTPSSPSGRSDR
jgi:hypothetical protein